MSKHGLHSQFYRPRPPLHGPHSSVTDNMLLLSKEDFEKQLERAAERGAKRCLANLGLENPNTARDIRELIDLLEAWRDARHTAWKTSIKILTTSVLAVLIAGIVVKFTMIGGLK